MAVSRSIKITWYIDRFDGVDCIVMTMGRKTRIFEILPKWRKVFAKRYLKDNLKASKN